MNFIPDEDGSASVFCFIVSECLCRQLKGCRNLVETETSPRPRVQSPDKTPQGAVQWRALSPTDM